MNITVLSRSLLDNLRARADRSILPLSFEMQLVVE